MCYGLRKPKAAPTAKEVMNMAHRKIETTTVPGSIVVDLNSGKTLERRVVGTVPQKDIPSKEDVEAYLTLRSFARV